MAALNLMHERPALNAARLIAVLLTVGIAAQISASPAPAARTDQTIHSAQRHVPYHSPARTTSVRVYLVAIGDNGRSGAKIGCGDSLVPVTRKIASTSSPLRVSLNLLLSDHHRYYGQSGLYNALYQSRLGVRSAQVVNGTATVRLVGSMRLGGICDDPRVGGQLRQTVLQFHTVRRAAIFVNNVPLWKRLSEK